MRPRKIAECHASCVRTMDPEVEKAGRGLNLHGRGRQMTHGFRRKHRQVLPLGLFAFSSFLVLLRNPRSFLNGFTLCVRVFTGGCSASS